ncbi:unnamed protein product, partial [Notodromas monacha]
MPSSVLRFILFFACSFQLAPALFNVTDTFSAPRDNPNVTSQGQPRVSAEGDIPVQALNGTTETGSKLSGDSKIDAVEASKKDFIDDINDISRRILALEDAGAFAIIVSGIS